MKIAAMLFDLGDVIMQEETEFKDAEMNTQHADLVQGMADALRTLKSRGYKFGLVADTRPMTAWNVLHQHNLYDLFDALAISEEVGCEKPDRRMFLYALDKLNIAPQDYGRVLMVGNNIKRDVRGANEVGIVSVWFHWNDRYAQANDGSEPKYKVHDASELLRLVDMIENKT